MFSSFLLCDLPARLPEAPRQREIRATTRHKEKENVQPGQELQATARSFRSRALRQKKMFAKFCTLSCIYQGQRLEF